MALDSTTILVAAAVLLAAYVKGATGMGFPLIATPMLTLLLDIRTAIVMLIIPNILMDLAQIFRKSFPIAIFRRFFWLLLFTVFGVFMGTKTLVVLPLWVLNLILGCIILIVLASSLFQFTPRVSSRAEACLSPVMGILGGFIMGMTNVMGPPMAVYLYSLKLNKTEFVQTISTIFIMTKIWQVLAISTWNLFTAPTMRFSLLSTVFILMSFYLGLKTHDRVNQKTFNHAVRILLLITGAGLIVRAIT